VTDQVSKSEGSATLRYQVAVTRHSGGQALALRLTNFEFLEVDGHDARTPALRKQLRGALEAASALPTILVSPDGAFLDIVDMEALIDRIARSTAMPPKERKAMVEVMKSPAMLAAMKARSVEFWNVWVGLWSGADLEPGRRRELNIQTPLPNGTMVARPVAITHHGPDGPPGHVHLSFESTLRGGPKDARLRGALEDAAKDLAASGGKALTEDVEGFDLSTGGEVVTDPETLKPVTARSFRRTTVKLKGQPPQSQVEAHVYTFAWPKTVTTPAKTP
ncbi:MAG TPA: hypothetical protein VN914_12650, partial [Polyangia bacterium]|nr:hypothetical protein [Polyangia bacterium]